MEQHDFLQGSEDWHQHRRTHFNASDAPAMLGISPHKTRTQLLDEMATGIAPEVDEATQRRFDDGHRFEALARPLAEKIVGRPLYPVIGSEGKLSASFDGLTSDDAVCFEHKTLNDSIRSTMASTGDASLLPAHYRAQMEQQLIISGAEKCLFMATLWDGDECIEETHGWYFSDQDMRDALMQGWTRFAIDLETHQPKVIAKKPKAEAIMELPALFVQVKGEVTASNLREFKEAASTFIDAIKTDLQTDSDFANAEATVKFCKKAEENLYAAKKSALAQTASIDELMRTVDHIHAQLREKRLLLDKLVNTEKDKRKTEMVAEANVKYADHVAGLQAEIAGIRINLLLKMPNFGGAIKGLKSLASMHDALDTAVASGKIEADAVAKDVRDKLAWCKANADGYGTLFPDLQHLIGMETDAFQAVIKNRIAEHKAAEAAKEEATRARIQAEEEAKARAKVEAEEREKARAEAVALANREQLAREREKAQAVAKSDDAGKLIDAIKDDDDASAAVGSLQSQSKDAQHVRPSRESLIKVVAFEYGVEIELAEEWLIEAFETEYR